MFQVLGSATTATGAVPAADATDPREADHGLGAHAATPPAPADEASLREESGSGVEWLPRHAPHRWI